ncbi:MAG: ABC transporter ATP-binding protein [Syntrophorhabdales bacterium]|jgi:branched-chain amino acid transport system ATP-binding protein
MEAATVSESAVVVGADIQLRVDHIFTYYGAAPALKGISLNVGNGQIVAVLGSNGAGKTTLLKTINGMIAPRSGSIVFNGAHIEGLHPDVVIRRGLSTVAEGGKLFGPMSVKDNLLLGSYSLSRRGRRVILGDRLDIIYHTFPILKQRQKQKAETLSGGERQMLGVARALMSNPKLLVLDEPSLGLSPLLVTEMMHLLKGLSDQMSLSILLVEQNAKAAMRVSDYAYVLERGEVVLEGRTADVASDPSIRCAYLGGEPETEPVCEDV